MENEELEEYPPEEEVAFEKLCGGLLSLAKQDEQISGFKSGAVPKLLRKVEKKLRLLKYELEIAQTEAERWRDAKQGGITQLDDEDCILPWESKCGVRIL